MARRKSLTKLTELVEVHNIALSISRINKIPSGRWHWRRALYYAVAISGACCGDDLKKLRESLGLP